MVSVYSPVIVFSPTENQNRTCLIVRINFDRLEEPFLIIRVDLTGKDY